MLRFTRETLSSSRVHNRCGVLHNKLRTVLYLETIPHCSRMIGQSLSSVESTLGTIDYILIKEAYRGKGYGSILLTETERWMQQWYEVQKFQLLSQTYPECPEMDTLGFYQKNGWVLAERVHKLPLSANLKLMEKKAIIM